MPQLLARGKTRTDPEPQPQKTKTFAALQHPAFRWFFFGQLVSVTGTWIQAVAQQIVVYNMTGSEFALGAVALAQGIPSLVLGPVAGVIVERVSRRRLLVMTQSAMMLFALILAVLSFTGTLQLWHISLLALCTGVATSLDAPSRLSFFVEMVGKDDLPSGIVLNSMMFNIARVLGPALGGIALSAIGPSWCFLLNGLSFFAVLFGLVAMRVPPPKLTKGKREIIKPLIEGLSFVRTHPTIRPMLLLSALTSSFGLTFTVLVPPFADKVLGNTEVGTSALLTAQGLGALLASLFVASITNRGLRGITMTRGALAAPMALLGLAFASSVFGAAPMVFIAGFSFVCQFVITNTLIQTEVPDRFRGRVLSLYTITFFGLSPIGSLIMGATAEAINTVPAILLFAAINLVGAWLIIRSAPQIKALQ